jgi:hypothetical protein
LKNYEYNYERKNTITLAMVVNGEGSNALPMVGERMKNLLWSMDF